MASLLQYDSVSDGLNTGWWVCAQPWSTSPICPDCRLWSESRVNASSSRADSLA